MLSKKEKQEVKNLHRKIKDGEAQFLHWHSRYVEETGKVANLEIEKDKLQTEASKLNWRIGNLNDKIIAMEKDHAALQAKYDLLKQILSPALKHLTPQNDPIKFNSADWDRFIDKL